MHTVFFGFKHIVQGKRLYKHNLTVLHAEGDPSLNTNQYRKTSFFDESYKVLSSGLIYEPLLGFIGVIPFHDGD